jgi:hypothetical protein
MLHVLPFLIYLVSAASRGEVFSPNFASLGYLNVISAVLSIIIGLVFLLFGYKLFGKLVFLVGFFLGVYGTLVVLLKLEGSGARYAGSRTLVFVLVPLIVGIMCGLLLQCVYQVF